MATTIAHQTTAIGNPLQWQTAITRYAARPSALSAFLSGRHADANATGICKLSPVPLLLIVPHSNNT